MKSTENHIIDLLKENECVVVPGFGGFVLNEQKARITSGNEIQPPTVGISFNRSLTRDDGLLEKHIADEENISFTESRNLVENLVENWTYSMIKRKELHLQSLGFFKINDEGKWRYQPELSLPVSPASFGLYPIPLEDNNEEKKTAAGLENLIQKTIKQRRNLLKAVGIIPLVCLGLYFGINSFQQHSHYAGISSYFSTEKISNSIKNFFTDTKKEKTSVIKKQTEKELLPMAEEKTKFYIVAGSFSRYENAVRMNEELTAKGYTAEVLNAAENGFYRVAYASQPDSNQAIVIRDNIRTKENNKAWILKW